jgi:hypothetical protein
MALTAIAPGSTVQVKVVKQPTSAAATKTLVRVLSKDPAAQKEEAHLTRVRAKGIQWKQRGGRPWPNRMVKQRRLTGKPGEEGTILATVDVLRDLGSLERFVEVKAL